MTAPDPLAAHTSAAQQRILTAAEKRALTPADRLVLIRNGAQNLRRGMAVTIGDKLVLDVVLDMVDVVEQLAGQMGGASVRCAHERLIDQREDGGMLWCADCREEVTR